QIGAFLEADVQLHGDFTRESLTGGVDVDLAKFFIVSHVDLVPAGSGETGDFMDIEGFGRVGITMSPARGKKCGRCWRYPDEFTEEGGLCEPCEEAVAGPAPREAPTV